MSEYKAKRWLFTGVMLWRMQAEPIFLHPINWPWYSDDYCLCCER